MITNILKFSRETLIATWIDSQIRDYGRVFNLIVDSQSKKIIIKGKLKGEDFTTQLTIHNYLVTKKNGDTYLEFEKLETEREWLEVFLNRNINMIFPDQRIKFPNKFLKLIVPVIL